MTNPLDLGIARSAHRLVQKADEALALMTRSEQRQLNLLDILQGLSDYRTRRVTGFAAEALAELARIKGRDFDSQNPDCPWSLMHVQNRALLAAGLGGADGGFLVGVDTAATVLDVLRPYSLAMQSGATVYDDLDANAIFPRMTTDIAGQWLSSEMVAPTEQPPAFGGQAVTPKTWGFTCRFSRQLQMQAPNMLPFLQTTAARAAGTAVDTAALVGVGNSGTPLGLLNVAGIGTQSGTTYSHANSWTTRGTLAAVNVTDDAVSWLGSPDVRTTLATRERAAGDQFIWDRDLVTNRAARVTSILPAQTLICGDFSSLTFCFFGSGFQIDSTQFHNSNDFQAGISALRLLVSVDTFLQYPTAFVAVNNLT